MKLFSAIFVPKYDRKSHQFYKHIILAQIGAKFSHKELNKFNSEFDAIEKNW